MEKKFFEKKLRCAWNYQKIMAVNAIRASAKNAG